MKHLYIVILLMMIGYILLNMYFDWRMEKWVKRYKKQINKIDELEKQKEEVL
jgi:cytochrome bd-type quinol oxidase subunit 2